MGKKDVATNTFFKSSHRFADLFNTGLFHGKKLLLEEKLEDDDGSAALLYGETKTKEKEAVTNYRDVIKKAMYGMNFAVVGIENQTDIHYYMPVRIMGYDYLTYERQIKKIKEKHKREKDLSDTEFLSGFSQEDRIHAAVTLVVYYGKQPWDGPKSLYEMMDWEGIPEELKNQVADYPLHILDVRRFAETEKLETDVRIVFGFLQRQEDKGKLSAYIQENETEFLDMEEDAYDVLSILTNSTELEKIKEQCKREDGGIDMCRAIKEWGDEARAEGMAQGKAEGMAQGIARSIITVLESYGEVTEVMKNKILAQKDSEILSQWLKKAAVLQNVEAFFEQI